MKNKHVGFLVMGIALVMIIIVLVFNAGLKNIIASTCALDHGGIQCPMYDTVLIQTGVSLAIAGLVFLVGLFMVFMKAEVRTEIITKVKTVREKEKRKKVNYSGLDKDEKTLMRIIEASNGAIFQGELVDKSGFDKVKVSRILDKLQGRGFLERKRRGMSNIVILK